MKILHTSDWHIGKKLKGKELKDDHRLFFEWLLKTIQEQHIELMIVAGDIFDVTHPSNEALKQYYQVLLEITKTSCKHVIIIGGNHDSIHTLNAPKEILKLLNVQVVGGVPEDIVDEIINVNDEVIVCAVPFLRDKDVKKSIMGESYEDRIEAVKQGINKHYQQLADLVQVYKNKGLPIIDTGHLYVQNANLSDSERDIQVGNLAGIDGLTFPSIFDYVALGHVHIPQKIVGAEHIRYAGSPIPLSFKERSDQKVVIVLDTTNEQLSDIEKIKVPNFRKLVLFKGSFDEVSIKIGAHTSEGDLIDWAEIQVEETYYDPSLSDRLSELVHALKHVEVLRYTINYANKVEGLNELYGSDNITELDPKDVFEKRIEGDEIEDKDSLMSIYGELLDWMQTNETEEV